MPLRYITEMFCDRVAASKIYMKDKYTDTAPLEYFEKGKKTRRMHPETSDMIEHFLTVLAQRGEREAFSYIKNFLRTHDDY